jgi:hypothetical protein
MAPDAEPGCTDPKPWYRDNDGDGHGSGIVLMACTPPAGYVATNDDCDEDDARAFPGQTQYFDTPRPSGSYDFNCDKFQEKRWAAPQDSSCKVVGGNCINNANVWFGPVPECGVGQDWIASCSDACAPTFESRKQACR